MYNKKCSVIGSKDASKRKEPCLKIRRLLQVYEAKTKRNRTILTELIFVPYIFYAASTSLVFSNLSWWLSAATHIIFTDKFTSLRVVDVCQSRNQLRAHSLFLPGFNSLGYYNICALLFENNRYSIALPFKCQVVHHVSCQHVWTIFWQGLKMTPIEAKLPGPSLK